MRIIPKNTKVKMTFYKSVTVADVVIGFIGLVLIAIALSSKSVFGKLLMITTSLRQTEKAGIRVCFMSKAAPTGEIWFRSNLTRVCLIRQRKGLKTTKFITRKFMQ